MQNTPGPPMGYPPPPKRGVNPWTVVGIGCGGCGIVLIILLVAGGALFAKFFNKVADEVNKPTTPPPTEYVGVWKDAGGGKTLIIGKEGRGSFDESTKGTTNTDVNIDGGRVEIDSATKKLSVTFAGFGKTFHIDSAPKKDAKAKEMTLDGDKYKRTGDALPDGSGPATSSSSDKEGASESEKTDKKSSGKTKEKTSDSE